MGSYKLVDQLPPLPAARRGYRANLNVNEQQTDFVYCHDRSVIIRSVNNPSLSKEIIHHQCEVTAAAFSPMGNQVASGDCRGIILIWALDNDEYTIKSKLQPLSGRINDISWDSSGTRLACGGEGREKYAHAYLTTTQSRLGDISTHSRTVNSVAYRQEGTKYVATASDDYTVAVYRGPPFKTEKVLSDHNKFAHCVRFSTNSKFLASCGADGRLYVYNVDAGMENIVEFAPPGSDSGQTPHTLFSLSWSYDSSKIIASSASGSIFMWDLETQKLLNTFDIGQDDYVEGQQVACLYLNDKIMSLSLSRVINYIDPNSGSVFQRVKGHTGSVSTMAVAPDSKVWSYGSQGKACIWNLGSNPPSADYAIKRSHNMKVIDSKAGGKGLYSVAVDKTLSYLDYSGEIPPSVVSLPGTPISLALDAERGICLITLSDNIICFTNKDVVLKSCKMDFNTTAISIFESRGLVAVGSDDGQTRIYKYEGKETSFSDIPIILTKNMNNISYIDFSPDGSLVAVADTANKVMVYDVETGKIVINKWVRHAARVNCIKWSPDSKHAASGSLDTTVEIWSIDSPLSHVSIKPAHSGSVNSLDWISPDKIVTVGDDALIKTWAIDF